MWCKKCEHETNSEYCELCGNKTEPVIPTEVFWCQKCRIPVIIATNERQNSSCPLCGGQISYLSSDLRPVFPEERLLIEIILEKPMQYHKASVWANNNRYYFDGKSFAITSKHYKKFSSEYITEQLKKYRDQNDYSYFDKFIKKFIRANITRLNYIIDEAHIFIRKEAEKFPIESVVVSFSGGKD